MTTPVKISPVDSSTLKCSFHHIRRLFTPCLEVDKPSLGHTLDTLEQQTITIGQQMIRHLLCLHWDLLDQQRVDEYCAQFELDVVEFDGYASQKIACRLGLLHLQRQVCFNPQADKHIMPGNNLLPEHYGMIITRTLQEWACLFPQDLPFELSSGC